MNVDAFEDLEDPDKEHIDHSTGNAGVGMERWYHKVALVIDIPVMKKMREDEEEVEDSKHKKVEVHSDVIE
jgi:hypothetical protein